MTTESTLSFGFVGNGTAEIFDSYGEIYVRKRFWVLAIVLYTIIMIFICCGNALTIAAFYRRPCIRTRANYYIVQMALADFLLGISLSQHIMNFIVPDLQNNMTSCLVALSTSFSTCAASLSAIIAMNFDRFRSVMWPYTYDSELSPRKYIEGALQIWIPSLLLGVIIPIASYQGSSQNFLCLFVHTIRREYFMYLLFPFLYFTLIVVLTLNIPMFYIANKQVTMIQNQQQVVRSNEPNPEQIHFKKKLHLLKTVFIIFITFYGCWLPYTVAVSIEMYDDSIFAQPNSQVYVIARFCGFLAVLNSGMNPVIYAVRVEVFRKEFKKILQEILPSNRVQPNPS